MPRHAMPSPATPCHAMRRGVAWQPAARRCITARCGVAPVPWHTMARHGAPSHGKVGRGAAWRAM
eukprot:10136929-Lingulodinium_polyedra.AAC.1